MNAAAPTPRKLARPACIVRLARTTAEVQAAQRLRFEIFNLELGEGLAHSHFTGRDEDPFDACCDHLLVEDQASGEIVGTYRLQTGQLAAANLGYYSEQEFDFAPYEPLRCELIELGRACVQRSHRNAGTLHLLWRGIARYAVERKARYLIGCSSLTSQDQALGLAMYSYFAQHGLLAAPELRTQPTADCLCIATAPHPAPPPPPKLLRTYLSLGAKICSPPALDREFGTIDFLTLLDLQSLTSGARTHFGLDANEAPEATP